MKVWNDPKVVGKTPLLTVLLLEYANLGQLWRMWTQHTAAGQNLWSWISVGLALVLWINFYRVITPQEKFARWCTVLGLCLNCCVCLTVLFFRLIGRG